jgi:hypothetical protein
MGYGHVRFPYRPRDLPRTVQSRSLPTLFDAVAVAIWTLHRAPPARGSLLPLPLPLPSRLLKSYVGAPIFVHLPFLPL